MTKQEIKEINKKKIKRVQIRKLSGFECPHCWTLHDTISGAKCCSENSEPKAVDRWECLECRELFKCEEDAEHCCKDD